MSAQGAKGAEFPTFGVDPPLLCDDVLDAEINLRSATDMSSDDEWLGFLAFDE